MIDEGVESLVASGGGLPFRRRQGGAWTIDRHTPERAIAFDESLVEDMLRAAGLSRVGPIHRGTWSGRPDGRDAQDIVVVTRS